MKNFFNKTSSVLVPHYQGLTVKQIDELMFKEKTNIKDWPTGTKLIRINTEDWYTVEDWYFNIEIVYSFSTIRSTSSSTKL